MHVQQVSENGASMRRKPRRSVGAPAVRSPPPTNECGCCATCTRLCHAMLCSMCAQCVNTDEQNDVCAPRHLAPPAWAALTASTTGLCEGSTLQHSQSAAAAVGDKEGTRAR